MAITMIYIQLQSIYNNLQFITTQLQPTTMAVTMIYIQLQSIYNNLQSITT
jgi:hypothetical protein